MFIAHVEAIGYGCDYTIGCNHRFVTLPENITTVEEAFEYMVGNYKPEDYGGYGYEDGKIWGNEGRIPASVYLYEVTNKTDLLPMLKQRVAEDKAKKDAAKAEAQEAVEREELKKLKEKYEGLDA